MWQKLITLDTIHWYYEGPKPTAATRCYDEQARRCKSIAHTFSLISSILSNFFFPSLLMHKWKMVRGGPISVNRLLYE